MKIIHSKDNQSFSQFSLGCMNLPLNDKNETEAIIEYALHNGITYFDTADLYQFGKNETLVGEILSKYRSQFEFTIGTKVGNSFSETKEEQLGWNPSAKHIKNSVKDSLYRLNVSHIDLYQLHGGTIEDNKDETIQAFEDLKRDGIIKSYGISSIRMNVIDYYLNNSNINTLMSQFNPIDNRSLEVLETLQKDIVFLARGPLMQGLLTDVYKSVLENKHNDGVLGMSQAMLKETLVDLEKTYGPLSELSYRFLKYHDAVVINGASSLKQLRENLEHFYQSDTFTKEAYETLLNQLHLLKYKEHRS